MPDIPARLNHAVECGASDLHVIPGYRPTLRIHGRLEPLDSPELDALSLLPSLLALCPETANSVLETRKNTDFALELNVDGHTRRFRANYFYSAGNLAGCFRVILGEIPDFEWTGFPRELAEKIAHLRHGLVLITGITGSGKTTTLATIVNLLNQETGYRIITVEEPIEYLFPRNAGSIVTQREVGLDVHSFADGLKYGLRQDPDVILVGEIRDRETAQMALSAAETGHLVLSTLHTRDATGAISRYVDLFPQSVQSEIRSQLSFSLRAVISQHLLPSIDDGAKRELALEILISNSAIGSGIRFGKLETLERNIQTGAAEGMRTLDESIRRLFKAGRISRETAERFVTDRQVLAR
jgi:twitching motility protein PilT